MNKLYTDIKLAEKVKKLKKEGKTIALLHGVFDVLHVGHIDYFEEIKKKVDFLIISVTADDFVNKGPGRPMFKINERIRMLSKISVINFIVVSKSETVIHIIKTIKPNIYAKGHDYKNKKDDISKNIYKEIKAINSVGGKFMTANTPMHSSTKIINNETDFLTDSLKKFLKNIDKEKLKEKYLFFLKNPPNKKVLVIGEPIVDIYNRVAIQGKSSKNNILSSKHISIEEFGGGTILVADILKEFLEKVDYPVFNNNSNMRYIKKFLIDKKIKLKNINDKDYKFIIKKRFIDYYSNNRLYQINYNDDYVLADKAGNKLNNFIQKNHSSYDSIIVYDFGHGLINKEIIKTLTKLSDKVFLNCQSNSSNFGFNLVNKYKRAKVISMDEQEFRLCAQDKNTSVKDLIKTNKNFINKFDNFIITMGKFGCYHVHNNISTFTPTVYSTFKDTTGSGDVFFAIYISLKISKIFNDKEICLICHIAAGLHANTEGNKKNFDLKTLYKAIDLILK